MLPKFAYASFGAVYGTLVILKSTFPADRLLLTVDHSNLHHVKRLINLNHPGSIRALPASSTLGIIATITVYAFQFHLLYRTII